MWSECAGFRFFAGRLWHALTLVAKFFDMASPFCTWSTSDSCTPCAKDTLWKIFQAHITFFLSEVHIWLQHSYPLASAQCFTMRDGTCAAREAFVISFWPFLEGALVNETIAVFVVACLIQSRARCGKFFAWHVFLSDLSLLFLASSCVRRGLCFRLTSPNSCDSNLHWNSENGAALQRFWDTRTSWSLTINPISWSILKHQNRTSLLARMGKKNWCANRKPRRYVAVRREKTTAKGCLS